MVGFPKQPVSEEENLRSVLGFLLENENEIVQALIKEHLDQLIRLVKATGRFHYMFNRHMDATLRQKIRSMFSQHAGINSEQAMVIESNELVSGMIDEIIRKVKS